MGVLSMEIHKICSCFGHSEIEITEQLRSDVKTKIEDMIVNDNYRIFYLGGFGVFDALCHQVVSELKQKYPDSIVTTKNYVDNKDIYSTYCCGNFTISPRGAKMVFAK